MMRGTGRRISRGMKEGDLPDLLIVMADAGQLNVACEGNHAVGRRIR